MRVTCPHCKTSYEMGSMIPSGSRSTVICVVCNTQLEVVPRGIFYAYVPKVTIRSIQPEEAGIINGPVRQGE